MKVPTAKHTWRKRPGEPVRCWKCGVTRECRYGTIEWRYPDGSTVHSGKTPPCEGEGGRR